MKDIRVNLSFRNNRIVRRMEELGIKSVSELCRQMNTAFPDDERRHQTTVGLLINMKEPAKNSHGDWTPAALRLADFFRCMPEDLFSPEQQRGSLETNKAEAELTFAEVEQLTRQLPADPEALLLAAECRERVRAALAKLQPQEAQVLRMRFGIDGPEHTLVQIAAHLKLSPERIRAIEAHALRRLKSPSRVKDLADAACIKNVVKDRRGHTHVYHTVDADVIEALRSS